MASGEVPIYGKVGLIVKSESLIVKKSKRTSKKKNKNKKTRTVAMPLNLILKNFLN